MIHQTELQEKLKSGIGFHSKFGGFGIFGFVNQLNGEHHVALVKGEIGDGEIILCRVHSECLTGDTSGSMKCDCGEQLEAALKKNNEEMTRNLAISSTGRMWHWTY